MPTDAEIVAALDARDREAGVDGADLRGLQGGGAPLPRPTLRRTYSALARWDAIAPGTVMPESLASAPFALRMGVKDRDPELYSLLMGEPLPAATEAAILNGTWSDTAPVRDPEAERAQAVAQLLAEGNPYLPGSSLTTRLRLEQLDPEMARQQAAAAAPFVMAAQQQAQQRALEEQRQAQEEAAERGRYAAQEVARARIAELGRL